MHKLFTLLLLACIATGYSQTITLKGKVTGPDNFPLESATVYLTSVKDSTVVDYTITNQNGSWELKTRAVNQAVFLKISYVGFADYKDKFEKIVESRDFGTLKLADRSTNLDEVVIESEIPPIRVKQDTLEFDAASFKVRPDANVQELLKQLPGVDIDADGKITINGKEVNQIMVNGKPFFDKDGKIALQNLPAELIKKVQISDTKTKKEELSGQKATGNNTSINLTIDEDKNKGFFGKLMGGYGTNERYESSALVNYFKGARKISLLASSNNINSTGFSMNEIFDSMGGGRNRSFYSSSDGSFGINGMQFGGGTGITKSNMVGLNYADEWFKGFNPSMNYFYTSADSRNNNRSRDVTFVTDENAQPGTTSDKRIITESTSSSNNYKYAHNFNTEFQWKADSTTNVFFAPRFTRATSRVGTTSQQVARNQDDQLLNDSNGYTNGTNENVAFASSLNYNKILNKRGQSINFDFSNDNSRDDGRNLNNTTTNFYDPDPTDDDDTSRVDSRNQVVNSRQTRDTYDAALEFNEPVTDSLRLKVGSVYRHEQNIQDRIGYDFNDTTQQYTNYNDLLSNFKSSKTRTVKPYAGIDYNSKKLGFGFTLGTSMSQFNNYGVYRDTIYIVNRSYALPSAGSYLRYNLTKSKSIYVNYGYEVEFPQADQILPIADVSSTLVTRQGNANLDPNKYHQFYFSFNNFDYATRSGYYLYAGGSLYDNQVVTSTGINESAKQFISYENVTGTYNSWFGGDYSKSIKTEKGNKYRYSAGVHGGYDFDKGLTNNVLFSAKSLNIGPKLNFNYELGEVLTINPSYSYTYNHTSYTNYDVASQSNYVHKAMLQITNYWPKHFVMGNDFTYTYNSQLIGFKKDFLLWNASVGYNFLGDKLLFKVKAYDLLNQNLGTSRRITPRGITDTQNTVLKRYLMFSLTFNLKKFGDNKKDEGGGFWGF
jgi:hypothetical protein